MKAKLFEVVIHEKVEDDDKLIIPKTLFDDKVWAADEMAAGFKAMEIVNKGKAEDERISADEVTVLCRPF